MTPKYLTKSKFVLAMECPTKLYYEDRPDQYINNKTQNTFLQALAKAGFQVGELAKCYYRTERPVDLSGLNTDSALHKTKELLKQDSVVIFEAAVAYENLLLRADILIKNQNSIRLIEVKSSTWDASKDSFFMKNKKGILKDWLSYIYDIAFQKHVLSKAYPNLRISTYLGLLDKHAICPTQGLNQKFRITRDEKGEVIVTGAEKITDEDLSKKLIKEVNADDEIRFINEQGKDDLTLSEYIDHIATQYTNNQKLKPKLGRVCADCEFRASGQNLKDSKKCGFTECWSALAGFKPPDFERPSVLDIWYYAKKDELIGRGVYFQSQVEEEDVLPKKKSQSDSHGLSRSERQLLQIKKARKDDNSLYFDKEGLASEKQTWSYPLHFIDFETAAPAIPLDKGAHPYEGFAFQFSHHILYEDGVIEHADQFINTDIGINPNLNFIRALKKSLSNDNGTIFRYHNHENTYLNYILKELVETNNPIDDKEELMQFIQSITKPTDSSTIKWDAGTRCMVDLCKLVELYTFDPMTNGKTSIKKVLPAILSQSNFLQEKYSKKIYGSNDEIKSLNFKEPCAWVIRDGGCIADPYSLLPRIFEDIDVSAGQLELLFEEEELKDGGAASIAYMYMQFGEMTDIERTRLKDALLRYCELDTLAMVMIVETWLELLKSV